jgi:hypothetical protein
MSTLLSIIGVAVALVVWVAYAVGWKWLLVRITREGIWHGLKVAWKGRKNKHDADGPR